MENMINLQNENRLSSIEVGEMLNKEHKHVMRDIRAIIADLEEPSEAVSDLFIETTYIHPQNGQQYPMYLLSKEGCELYGTRLIGKVGTQFARKYVKQFNEMEKELDPITIALQAALDTRKRVDVIETDVQQLKETTRIDTLQEKQLSDIVKRKVLDAVGGKNSNAYSIAPRVFPDAWRVLKNHFGISSYKSLPRLKFDEAVELLNLWQPSASLQLEINSLNKQMDFGDDLK